MDPFLHLSGLSMEHVATQRNDEAAVFGRADEFTGPQEAAYRMLPANQGLQTDNFAAGAVILRLVDEKDLVLFYGLAQFESERESRANLRVHGFRKELIAISSLGFGAIQRDIGVGEKRLGVRCVAVTQGNSNACAKTN